MKLGCLYAEEPMRTVTVAEPVQSASPQRFERIYREHATFVFRTAYGVTGNREDAENILQAVLPATGRTRISRRMGQPIAN